MIAFSIFSNEYLFGNIILEEIPHPEGFLGTTLSFLSFLCHYIGSASFFAIVLPILYLCFDRKLGIKLGVGLLLSGVVNGFSKYLFENPRPTHLSENIMLLKSHADEAAFGFPSGHSHISILVWGIVFLRFKNVYIRLLSLFFIIFTPFSRMYIGVHYPGDVIGGFIMGFVTLVFIELLFHRKPNFPELPFTNTQDKSKILRSISLLIMAITFSILFFQNNASTRAHISSFSQAVSSSASMGGFLVGILLLKYAFKTNYFDWSYASSVTDFSLRFLILVPGIVLLYFGAGILGKTLFSNSDNYAYVYRYFRYFFLNLYIVLLAPYILKNIRNGIYLKGE